MASKSELHMIIGETMEVAQFLELELGTILLVQEADENKWYENPIDNSKAYEKLLEKVNKNSLGASLKKLREKINHKDDLVVIMEEALQARNRFTHHIFREHGMNRFTDNGRDKMIADIKKLNEKMEKAYSLAQPISERLVLEHYNLVQKHS